MVRTICLKRWDNSLPSLTYNKFQNIILVPVFENFYCLTLSTLGKIFSSRQCGIFSPENGF